MDKKYGKLAECYEVLNRGFHDYMEQVLKNGWDLFHIHPSDVNKVLANICVITFDPSSETKTLLEERAVCKMSAKVKTFEEKVRLTIVDATVLREDYKQTHDVFSPPEFAEWIIQGVAFAILFLDTRLQFDDIFEVMRGIPLSGEFVDTMTKALESGYKTGTGIFIEPHCTGPDGTLYRVAFEMIEELREHRQEVRAAASRDNLIHPTQNKELSREFLKVVKDAVEKFKIMFPRSDYTIFDCCPSDIVFSLKQKSGVAAIMPEECVISPQEHPETRTVFKCWIPNMLCGYTYVHNMENNDTLSSAEFAKWIYAHMFFAGRSMCYRSKGKTPNKLNQSSISRVVGYFENLMDDSCKEMAKVLESVCTQNRSAFLSIYDYTSSMVYDDRQI